MRILTVSLALLLTCTWLTASPAQAETYKWTDKDGVVHFTDSPFELPEPQRTKALRELERKEKERQKKKKETPAPLPDGSREEQLPPATGSSYSHDSGGGTAGKGSDRFPTEAELAEKQDSVEPVVKKGTQKEWAKKATTARQAVADLEKHCKQLEDNQNQSRRQGLLFGRGGALADSAKAGEDLKECKARLVKAIQWRDKGLPDEARRAGAPRGWLR